jgi:2-polyprenyl-6-methoxyphenol hydroxylase-like FAD-dependent oxidoreductase
VQQKAIIVGAGIAGLAAGIALSDAGWDVALYEQAPNLTAMGAALSIWPNAVTALDRLGCGDAFQATTPRLDHFGVSLSSGVPIFFQTVNDVAPGRKAYLPSRTQLQTILLDRLGSDVVHLDHQLSDFSSTPDGVAARFSNGQVATGDLLVAADGIWSKIAQSVIGDAPHHTGYGGLLGMCPPIQSQPDANTGIEYWGPRARLGLFDHGDAGKYWFYMRNEPTGPAATELTREFVAQELSAWPRALREAVEATPLSGITPFSVHAKPPPKRLGKGNIICVGDAAHAMEPNLGQGACQALDDAVALGVAARGPDVSGILGQFEQARLKRVRRFVKLSAQGSLVAHRFPALLTAFRFGPVRAMFAGGVRAQIGSLYTLN